jgi:hypothetical protein
MSGWLWVAAGYLLTVATWAGYVVWSGRTPS